MRIRDPFPVLCPHFSVFLFFPSVGLVGHHTALTQSLHLTLEDSDGVHTTCPWFQGCQQIPKPTGALEEWSVFLTTELSLQPMIYKSLISPWFTTLSSAPAQKNLQNLDTWRGCSGLNVFRAHWVPGSVEVLLEGWLTTR